MVGFVALFVLVPAGAKLLVTGSKGGCPVGLIPVGIQKVPIFVTVAFPARLAKTNFR